MSAFRVGQRVKRVREPIGVQAQYTTMPIGATGTVVETDYDGHVRVKPDRSSVIWGCEVQTLAPLTPPAVDRFLETVKSWGPLQEKELDRPLVEIIGERSRRVR